MEPLVIRFFGSIQIFVLRTGEGLWGSRALSWIILPLIYWDLTLRLIDYPKFRQMRAILPQKFWRDITPSRHYFLMIRNWQSTLAAGLLSDRLRSPTWRQRIWTTGTPPHQRPEWGKRPVILVFLHTGGYGLLRHWLRAQGLHAATYLTFLAAVYRTPWARKIFVAADERNGLSNVPSTFKVEGKMRALLGFLVPGHIVSIALDGQSPSSALFHANGYPIHLSTGVVNLAILSKALLLPVSVRCPDTCKFEIRFGVPVPDGLMDRLNPKPAVQFMLDQLWKDVEEEPHSICWGAFHALAPHITPAQRPWP